MKKRLLSLVLALTMCVSFLPTMGTHTVNASNAIKIKFAVSPNVNAVLRVVSKVESTYSIRMMVNDNWVILAETADTYTDPETEIEYKIFASESTFEPSTIQKVRIFTLIGRLSKQTTLTMNSQSSNPSSSGYIMFPDDETAITSGIENSTFKWVATSSLITVGTQDNALTYGTAASSTFGVTLTNVTEPESFDVAWYDNADQSISAPAGVTTSYNKDADKLTVNTTDATPAGTYKFTLASGGATSDKVTLTVQKAKVDVPTAETGLIYNGSLQTGVTLPQDAKYTLSDNTATDAGDYTATATLTDKDNYVWDLTTPTSDNQTISWSIAKKTPTAADFTFTASSDLVYNGQGKAATVQPKSGVTGMGAITVYYSADGEEWTYNPVTNANTYLVAIDVAEGSSYTSVTKLQDPSWTFTITKAKQSVPTAATGLVYNGEEQTGVKASETAKYTLSNNKATGAGDYVATAVLSDKRNYEWDLSTPTTDDQNIPWSIAKADQTLAFTDSTITKNYGDASFKQEVSGAETTVTYSSSDETVATVNSSTGEVTILKAGSATITASAVEDKNYKAAEKSYTLTVNKAQDEKQVAKTGDTTNMWLYIMIAALALGAMGAGVVAVRKKANR